MSIFSRRRRLPDGTLEKPRIGEEHVTRIRDQILTSNGPVLITADDVQSVLGRVPDELPSMTAEGDRDFYRSADVRTILQGGKLADVVSSIEPDGAPANPPFLARPEIEKPAAGEHGGSSLPVSHLPPIPASARLPEVPRNPDPKTLEWNARMFCLKSNRRPRPVRPVSCIYCGAGGARVCDRCHQIVLSLRGVTEDDQRLVAVHRILANQDRNHHEQADRDRRKAPSSPSPGIGRRGSMKLLINTGRAMRVYELGKALITLRANKGVPIKTPRPWHILPDDKAKEIARDLLRTGLYEKTEA